MRIFLICAVACALAGAQDSRYAPQGGQIPGPVKSSDFAEWLADIKQWRAERLPRSGNHGSEYDRAELKWTQPSFIQPQMMGEDRYFYDPLGGRHNVERRLHDLPQRYGASASTFT